MYSKKSLDHVIPFDGTNLPLWKLGLDVALEENHATSIVDGTFLLGMFTSNVGLPLMALGIS